MRCRESERGWFSSRSSVNGNANIGDKRVKTFNGQPARLSIPASPRFVILRLRPLIREAEIVSTGEKLKIIRAEPWAPLSDPSVTSARSFAEYCADETSVAPTDHRDQKSRDSMREITSKVLLGLRDCSSREELSRETGPA